MLKGKTLQMVAAVWGFRAFYSLQTPAFQGFRLIRGQFCGLSIAPA
jgi:hypothetical protein